MKVFVTGASGHIGSHIIPLLVADGHSVSGLARSDASAAKVSALGATPVLGTHTDLAVLAKAAAEADAVIHCAFNHDIMAQPNGMVQACVEDRAAITAMCDALVGSGKTFIYSSGTMATLGPDEKSVKPPVFPRTASEELTISYAEKGVRAIAVRLPPVVHGPGKEHPFITAQIEAAKRQGFAGYVEDGSTRWPSVHVDDVARLYVLALDTSKVPSGSRLHAVAEQGIPTKDIATFIAQHLNLKTQSVPKEEAMNIFGFVGMLLGMDNWTTTTYTKEWTGWTPTGATLFEDLENYSGFA